MIFDQYQRYKTIQIIAEYIKSLYKLEKISILELGANEECNLEKVLPNENIQYSDIKISAQMEQSGKFVEADGRNLYQFEDEAFDIVIALDVLEHVPDKDRESFLTEAYRVSKYMAILCFPYDAAYNCSAERCANNYYKAIYGCDHIWLKEHIENGLPKMEEIEKCLQGKEINYSLLHHGNITLWEELIKALFASYRNSKYFDLMESIDEFYAESIYQHDMVQKSYRIFVMMGRDAEGLGKVEEYLRASFDGNISQEELKHIHSNIADLKRLGEREEREENDYVAVKLYYDYGTGYNEENTQLVNAEKITENKYKILFTENEIQNLLNIRVDPLEGGSCIVTKCNIRQGEEKLPLGYSRHLCGKRGIVLFGNDPIIMSALINQKLPVDIELEFIREGKEFTEEILSECEEQIEYAQQKEERICELDNEITNLNEKRKITEEQLALLEKQQEEKEQYIAALEKHNKDKEKQIRVLEEEKLVALTKQLENYKKKDNEKEKIIASLEKQLDEANKKYEHILNTNSWKLTAPLRAIYKKSEKKSSVTFDSSNGEPDVSYNVEVFNYDNNLLETEGWIFDQISLNSVGDLEIIFEHKGNILRKYPVKTAERKDVQKAHELLTAQIGFGIQVYVENFSELDVYLGYGNKGKIFLGTIKGGLKSSTDEELHIFFPKKKKFYNLNSIQMCRKATGDIREYVKKNETAVDIIIPIYNGYDFLPPLIASAVKTNIAFRFILINDNSTDERIAAFSEDVQKRYPNTLYIKNEKNLGFVQSVNKGLCAAQNHVVLLNTDVELPELWLERLMYPIFTNPRIATTTPYTNSGTICSFPEFCKDNKLIINQTVDTMDKYFQRILPSYAQMPTGVGFCMGMNYGAIKKVGLLDAETFGKGYGEENDWCQRAIAAGYINVQVENLFVYHKHGGSFLSEEKKKLLENNSKALSKLHPDYLRSVADFCKRDINSVTRETVLFECLKEINAVTEIYFNHNLGGGATDYLNKKIKEITDDKRKYIEIVYDVYEKVYCLKCVYQEYSVNIYANQLDELFEELDGVSINKIVINELVTYPNLYETLKMICRLKKQHQAELTMLIHDFYCVCPTINLLTQQNVYCYLPDAEKCEQCVKCNQNLGYTEFGRVADWRKNWKEFLNECDEILAFSEDSKNIIEKTYGTLNNVKVQPHRIKYLPDLSKKKKHTNMLNIGLLGVLSERKGLSIVKQMLKIIESKNLNINIILIGTCEENIESKHFKETGKYSRERIPYLVCENDIDIFFISSVWPETFSYTAEEVKTMNLPIAVFQLGAPAERLKNYDKGLIISKMNAQTALNEIEEFMSARKAKETILTEKKNVLCTAEYLSFSSRYRLDHLREEMFLQGIASEFFMLDEVEYADIEKYTEVVIYRCSEYEKVCALVKRARQKGIKVYYDIDDYIFEYSAIESLDFLKDSEYDNFEEYSEKIYACMDICDEFITSTNHMKKAINKAFPERKVYVNRNRASMEMVVLSQEAEKKERNDDKVILGYFSGSKTHNHDFAIIEEAVVEVMEKYKNVYLKIAGCLELGAAFNKVRDRISYLDFMPWQKLPEEISKTDINLMPTEDTFFHSCKSENKWMEAALVKVATIASYNDELTDVIENEKTGVLCRTPEEWKEKLAQLICDKKYRDDIAVAAYEDVMQTHLTASGRK